MAPEQAASRHVGPEADWYAVGVVLFEALTGRVPFTGPSLQVLMHKQQYEPSPPRAFVSDTPADLDLLCVDLLRFDPGARPRGDEVLRRLGVAGDGTAAAARARAPGSADPPPFVGRARELAELRRAFEDTRGGLAVTVLVRGESGVGKTALIRQLVALLAAEGSNAVVLAGRCYERETVPYKAFDGVIDALSRHLRRLTRDEVAELMPVNAALLPHVFPVLGRVEAMASAARGAREVRDPPELRNRMFAALRELMTRLAQRQPLVVVIDDLQWADQDSLLLLWDLMRREDAPPLLLLA
jgi:hypothetical protein